jgi:hypothetical protein
MNRLLWTLASFSFAAALAFGVAVQGARPAHHVESDDESIDRRVWQYSWPESRAFRDLPGRFDLSALVTLNERPDCTVRLIVNAREENDAPSQGVFVDLHARGITVGRVEGGIAIPRGSRSISLSPGKRREIELKRRGADLAVAADGVLCLLSRDHSFSGGRTALGVMGGAHVSLKPLRRLTDLPEFGDDFMRSPDDPSPWTEHAGTWKNQSLSTPSMSANAFSYLARASDGGATPAFATAGSEFWDQYALHTAIHPGKGGAVGVAVCVTGPERYVLFRWTARKDQDIGSREVVLVSRDGDGRRRERVIAKVDGGYTPGQWYRLSATSSFGSLVVAADGHELVRARSDAIVSGSVGLWASGEDGTTFDDVLVAPVYAADEPSLELAARSAAEPSADWNSRWDRLGGTWSVSAGALTVAGERLDDAKLISSAGDWEDYSARVSLKPDALGRAGLVTNYRDEMDHVLLTTDFGAKRVTLERVRAGVRSTLDEAPLPQTSRVMLRMENELGHLTGFLNGQPLVEAWDRSASAGRVGVYVGRGSRAAFSSFHAEALPHRRQIRVENSVFESDKLMSGWAEESADWYRSSEGLQSTDIYWHTAPFHGDVELALDLPELDLPEGMIVLGIGKSPTKKNNGYGWKLRSHGEGGHQGEAHSWHLALTREGSVVKEVALESGHRVDSLFVRKRGSGICAGVNGSVLAEFIDDDPLPGGRIAFLANKIEVSPQDARVYGGRVFDYRFNEAPTEWRSASGTWRVTNRWMCDPRWSFFSGLRPTETDEKAVVIWNKRRFGGDVVIDLFIGPKMDTSRGKRYEYARDFNLTIAADGKDLTSGYSFIFGGFKNTRSGIYKGSTPLAETADLSARIPSSMIIHQRWYHVRVKRTGNTLKYRVNFNGRNIVALEATDDTPLSGDRIAIWSYDCSIMVARMRIAVGASDTATSELESPDAPCDNVVHTLYDRVPPTEEEGQ